MIESMTHKIIYSAHQPDLLPYSGFFYKMAHAHIFDLKIWDQYVNKGYQRRVMMRGSWASLPLEPTSSTVPINTLRLKPEAAEYLATQIYNRYRLGQGKALMWDERGEDLCEFIRSLRTLSLWEFNFQLILYVRDLLGINTPLGIGHPPEPELRGSRSVIDAMTYYPGDLAYLSGTGARTYMGDCQEFHDAGIPVIWSNHKHVTGDSIVTVLMDHEDALSIVLKEHESEPTYAAMRQVPHILDRGHRGDNE
jgi:hypothetical protein